MTHPHGQNVIEELVGQKQATGNLNKFTNETYIACKLINVKTKKYAKTKQDIGSFETIGDGRKQAVVYTFRLVVSLHIERGHK